MFLGSCLACSLCWIWSCGSKAVAPLCRSALWSLFLLSGSASPSLSRLSELTSASKNPYDILFYFLFTIRLVSFLLPTWNPINMTCDLLITQSIFQHSLESCLSRVRNHIAVCATSTAPLRELSAILDHTVLPATRQRWHSRLYPSQLRLVLDLATPEGCKAELVEVVGLVKYQGGIPARRQSPIPVLTGLNVEQLRSYDECRYHSAKPPTSRRCVCSY